MQPLRWSPKSCLFNIIKHLSSFAPQLQLLSFHTRVCSLGKVVLLNCWLDYLGWAHLKETVS